MNFHLCFRSRKGKEFFWKDNGKNEKNGKNIKRLRFAKTQRPKIVQDMQFISMQISSARYLSLMQCMSAIPLDIN